MSAEPSLSTICGLVQKLAALYPCLPPKKISVTLSNDNIYHVMTAVNGDDDFSTFNQRFDILYAEHLCNEHGQLPNIWTLHLKSLETPNQPVLPTQMMTTTSAIQDTPLSVTEGPAATPQTMPESSEQVQEPTEDAVATKTPAAWTTTNVKKKQAKGAGKQRKSSKNPLVELYNEGAFLSDNDEDDHNFTNWGHLLVTNYTNKIKQLSMTCTSVRRL
ncbi:uncharacterized protein EV420DRAFT_1638303 [Desarmillaria tabescens]|uniref:Uncharacterized protein n=1 Tax=Armillaria tabescens TaxID=1929756 RepID=A0AA39NFN1_ARMTA|nr:uncharacterized protein EV420DRAFT_1638303 [Desarmillaria tabescens]KAK0464754.1 hypothetical protein EV420DRAFT_1638303 [Desarmillaria tabescens]